MRKTRQKIIGLLMVGAMIAQLLVGIKPVYAAEPQSVRVAGANRYETANAVASKFWQASDYAILARGDEYPDALCAGPLAYAYKAPILLTDPNAILDSTLNVLNNLKVKTVFIVGGTGAVSGNIESKLKSKYNVIRIAGEDRYKTSVAIAENVKKKLGSVSRIALATGENYPDALSVSSIASKLGMPILLTETNRLPSSIGSFIKGNPITQTYVVGGSGVISNTVYGLVPKPKRLGGINRYATNVEILKEFSASLNFNKLFIAVGDSPVGKGFADALSGSAAAALSGSPVVLIYETLPGVTESFLSTKISGATTLVILGGTGAVPQGVETKLLNTINIPTLYGVTLTDSTTGRSVKAVIEEPSTNMKSGRITFNIPASYVKFNGGNAVLSEDLKSASISSLKVSRTVYNIKKTDNFAKIIFDQMAAEGYNPTNGILSSNIKYLLNGATITLTDLDGHTKTYTILINIV